MKFKLTVLATALFALFIAWVIYMADSGQKSIFFDLVKMIPFGDKLGHVVLFGLLALGSNAVFHFRGLQTGRWTIPYGAILVFLVAVVEELSQQFIPGRSFDLYDLTASVAGIVLFSLFPRDERRACRGEIEL